MLQQPAFLSPNYNIGDGKITRKDSTSLSFPDWQGGFAVRYAKASYNRFLPHCAAAASSSAAPGSGSGIICFELYYSLLHVIKST